MTKTVIMEVVTVDQEFPLGTAEGEYLYELVDSRDVVISFVTSAETTATFTEVAEGASYTARVTKNGVVATQAFDIPASTEKFPVPSSVTITINA